MPDTASDPGALERRLSTELASVKIRISDGKNDLGTHHLDLGFQKRWAGMPGDADRLKWRRLGLAAVGNVLSCHASPPPKCQIRCGLVFKTLYAQHRSIYDSLCIADGEQPLVEEPPAKKLPFAVRDALRYLLWLLKGDALRFADVRGKGWVALWGPPHGAQPTQAPAASQTTASFSASGPSAAAAHTQPEREKRTREDPATEQRDPQVDSSFSHTRLQYGSFDGLFNYLIRQQVDARWGRWWMPPVTHQMVHDLYHMVLQDVAPLVRSGQLSAGLEKLGLDENAASGGEQTDVYADVHTDAHTDVHMDVRTDAATNDSITEHAYGLASPSSVTKTNGLEGEHWPQSGPADPSEPQATLPPVPPEGQAADALATCCAEHAPMEAVNVAELAAGFEPAELAKIVRECPLARSETEGSSESSDEFDTSQILQVLRNEVRGGCGPEASSEEVAMHFSREDGGKVQPHVPKSGDSDLDASSAPCAADVASCTEQTDEMEFVLSLTPEGRPLTQYPLAPLPFKANLRQTLESLASWRIKCRRGVISANDQPIVRVVSACKKAYAVSFFRRIRDVDVKHELDTSKMIGVVCSERPVAIAVYRTQKSADGALVAYVALIKVDKGNATAYSVPKEHADSCPWRRRGLGSFSLHLIKQAARHEAGGAEARVELTCRNDGTEQFFYSNGFREVDKLSIEVRVPAGHVRMHWSSEWPLESERPPIVEDGQGFLCGARAAEDGLTDASVLGVDATDGAINDTQEGVQIRHTPTKLSICLSQDQIHAKASSESANRRNRRAAEKFLKRPLSECCRALKPTRDRAAAATVVASLLDHPSFKTDRDGVGWVRKGCSRNAGNLLSVDGADCRGFGNYRFVEGKREAPMQQMEHTLRVVEHVWERMVARRDKLASEGHGMVCDGFDLACFAKERLGGAFVIAYVFLIEQMQSEVQKLYGACGPLVDSHTPNSANPYARFTWHVDDHAEQDSPRGPYIAYTVVCQCSPGVTSMAIAGLPREINYLGVGGFILFPAWALHRTMRVEPEGRSLWKMAGFFQP